jgi:chaperonin GroEL (HSP60 family)
MKTRITNAKIAVLDMNLQKHRMNLGVNIVVDDPDQLEDIRKRYLKVVWASLILFTERLFPGKPVLLLNASKKSWPREQMSS